MSRPWLSVFFLLVVCLCAAQKHPLSKSDSGLVFKSLEKYEYLLQEKDLRGASGALNDAAFVYWNNNHYASAAEYYEKSLILNEKVANENGIAMINNNLGMLYADLGDYEKSLEKFTKTLAARRSNKEPVGVISALVNMSVVLNNLSRYEESIERLSEALDIARELYDKQQMRSVYGMLSETYEKKGDVERSLKYFELYKTFHEEIQREEIKSVNKELQEERLAKQLVEAERAKKENELLKSELEIYKKDAQLQEQDSINQSLYSNLTRKEVDIQLLEKSKQLADMKAKAQLEANQKLKYLRNSLIIAVIALGVITILIWINVRKTKKHRDELAEKNLRIESQKCELEATNQALEVTNHTKDRIFSIISHDLRSPIKSLQGFFHYINLFELPEELEGAFQGMEHELINSATLLDNLLAWSKSQIQKQDPDLSEFRLKLLVDETLALLKTSADKKNIKLICNIDPEETIYSDPQMIKIAIRNLIQNAIKFTNEGGIVSIFCDFNDKETSIRIKDSGIGMSDHKVQSLFDIKTNKSTLGTAKEVGSGLGLILTKELVEQAGGKIAVTSIKGEGSEFSINFTGVPKSQLV